MAFVKFSRGLLSTYNNLSRKDPDTLYLVYESTDSLKGQLYLGNKLISQVGTAENISLNELTDVVISGELQDGMLLYYNGSTGHGRWEAGLISDIISDIPTGRDRISIVTALNTIDNPQDKDIAIVGQDVYIYSNGGWSQLTDSSLIEHISDLESQVGHAADENQGIPATGLYKDIADLKENVYTKTEVLEQIANAAHLRYQIVNDLTDIDVNDDEVDNTIFLVPKVAQQSDGYDEYFVINGVLEKIGSWDVDLSNYITEDDNRLLSDDDKDKLAGLGLDENRQTTIQATQVGDLINVIENNQYIKSVQSGTFEVTEAGQLQLKSVPSIDLSGYVQTEVFQNVVGDLTQLTDRVNPNSSLVQEINQIKESVIWQELIAANNNSGD